MAKKKRAKKASPKPARKSGGKLRLKKKPLRDLAPKAKAGAKGGTLSLTSTLSPAFAPPYVPVGPVLKETNIGPLPPRY